ncbi:thiamine diphosphokinase [Bacteroidales bacterium]|nr:thiamine diphosphokinase [Bacteroidales bacterium]
MESIVVLANGEFPVHEIPVKKLRNANRIVCCDGAVDYLVSLNIEPTVIVGDMDSISRQRKEIYKSKIVQVSDQDTNDLTKAVHWCINEGITRIDILGATNKREDHTLGNISLLADYTAKLKVEMHTNYGVFSAHFNSGKFDSHLGQQVSIFSLDPQTSVSSQNLKYALNNYKLDAWWKGTLNESLGDWFELTFESGKLVVFRQY